MDGSTSKAGCGARAVIRSLTGEKVEHVTEYEALLVGIRLEEALGASRVHFHTDSRLVTNQVRG